MIEFSTVDSFTKSTICKKLECSAKIEMDCSPGMVTERLVYVNCCSEPISFEKDIQQAASVTGNRSFLPRVSDLEDGK